MKVVNDLYSNIKDKRFYQNQFKSLADKQNILFVDPVMTSFDFYTMIIPYLALGGEDSNYQTAITGLYRYSEINSIPPKYLSENEVKWADVVVLPMTLEKFNGSGRLYQELREINPNIKIIQTVEYDFYEIKSDHHLLDFSDKEKLKPTKKEINSLKKKMITRYEDNCKGADRLVVLNPNLAKKLISKGFKDVKWCPVFIDEDTFKENIDFSDTLGIKNAEGIMYLSCELIDSTKSAFKEYIPIFVALKEKYKENFHLIVIGKNPSKLFPNLDFEYERIQRGSIVHQMKSIVRSSADIHLILNKKNEYSNNSESLYTFIERGLFGVPIVSIPISPYKEIIKPNKNGYILKSRKDLLRLVDEFMKDKKQLIEVSTNLKNSIVDNFQLDNEKRETIVNVFFNYELKKSSENDDELSNED